MLRDKTTLLEEYSFRKGVFKFISYRCKIFHSFSQTEVYSKSFKELLTSWKYSIFFFLSAFSSMCKTSCILSCAFIFTVCCLPSLSSCLLLCYHVLHLLSLEQLIYNALKKVMWALKVPSSALTACHIVWRTEPDQG